MHRAGMIKDKGSDLFRAGKVYQPNEIFEYH